MSICPKDVENGLKNIFLFVGPTQCYNDRCVPALVQTRSLQNMDASYITICIFSEYWSPLTLLTTETLKPIRVCLKCGGIDFLKKFLCIDTNKNSLLCFTYMKNEIIKF